ncbi:hypothetical protein GQ44DRAFT_332938 [Phaeosphaeriaceae sp. PMI808]|nr:hypothetical protein GQ44DRAFT_332938 [Phaeosphaeriaceae sp. PMI808]
MKSPAFTLPKDDLQASQPSFHSAVSDITSRCIHPLFYSGHTFHRPNHKIAVHKSTSTASPHIKTHDSQDLDDKMADRAPTLASSPTSALPRKATFEDGHIDDEEENTNSLISPSQPGSSADCQQTSPQNRSHQSSSLFNRPDYASQIIWETFNDASDPMPYGYSGTFGGIRWARSTVEDYCPCGTTSAHYLTCGHTIVSNEPCGTNCKTGKYCVQPFNCPECHKIVRDVYENKLTDGERAKIEYYRAKAPEHSVTLAVEFVTRHMSLSKGNVTETLLAIIIPEFVGRPCLYYGPTPGPPSTLAEEFRSHHDSLQRKRREFLGEMKEHLPKTLEKRKCMAEESSDIAADDSNKRPRVML